MKRAIPVFVILVATLSVLLYLRLRKQQLEAQRPSGGSATVEGTEVDVTARLPARITAIKVQAGDAVKQGQVLVELDCAEPRAALAQAEAMVAAARVALDTARTSVLLAQQGTRTATRQAWAAASQVKTFSAQEQVLAVQRAAAARTSKRVEQVHRAGAATDQLLDQTQTQVAGLDSQVLALRATAQAAEAAALTALSAKDAAGIQAQVIARQSEGAAHQVAAAEAARDRAAVAVAECTIKAPRDGYVLVRSFEPGEAVLPGSRVLTLVDIREVKATFYLPNAELGAAKPGTKVEAKADAHGQRVFDGRVIRVGVEAEFTPRNVQTREDRDRLVYQVEVAIPNPEGLLRPGMPVEIRIPGTGKGSR
jgi:HlyD family secretion protein